MKRSCVNRLTAFIATSTLLCQLALLMPARADWNPGDPSKWYQLPDLQNGMDVLATWNPAFGYYKILADDFLCTQTGPITDIHIWGSWLYDRLPKDTTGNLIPPLFHLSIHADIPATPTFPYSQPGALLWQMNLQPTVSRLYATAPSGTTERFYDPNINQVIGYDTQIWQYNFLLPVTQAFIQHEGTVYWLDVQVEPQPPGDAVGPFVFGWKTSYQHWNDDAVFGDNTTFGGPPDFWRDMHDPVTGESLDMAFVLTTIPEPGSFGLLALGGAMVWWLKRRNS